MCYHTSTALHNVHEPAQKLRAGNLQSPFPPWNSNVRKLIYNKEIAPQKFMEFKCIVGWFATVMSEYHKMDTNEYPNIFGCHIMYGTNI